MDQKKIGKFLKHLRKNKELTQEQLAEHFCVSPRTISRWENGNNMPDVDILVRLADFYDVDIRELIEGEKKNKNIDNEIEETVLKTAEYMNIETERYTKRVHWLLLTGVIFWFVSSLISHTDLKNNVILDSISSFSEGAAIGMIFCVIVFTGRYEQRIRTFKQRLLKRQ